MIDYGSAGQTARNILGSSWQFRAGFEADLFAALLFLLAAGAVYTLLRPVHRDLATLFLFIHLVGVAVQAVSDLLLSSAS